MLEPVRQYAAARLDERDGEEEARARHAAWTVDFAEAADAGLRGPDEVGWRGALEAELGNLQAAHRWCLDNDPGRAIRLASALYWHAWCSGPAMIFSWAEETVARFGHVAHPRLPAAYATAATGAWRRGDLPAAHTFAEAGIACSGADPSAARAAWEALGDSEVFPGNYQQALAAYDRAIELARLAGDDYGVTYNLVNRPIILAYTGRVDEAIAASDGLAAALAAERNPTLLAYADYVNGEIRLERAPAEALPYLRRAAAAAHRIGNRFIAGVAGLSAASCEARIGVPARALGLYSELIDHWHRTGAWNQQWITLRTLIELFARLGRDTDAAVLFGALTASASASPVIGADASRIADALAALRARLGEQRFAAMCAEGAGYGDNEAVAFALRCLRRTARGAGAPSGVTAG